MPSDREANSTGRLGVESARPRFRAENYTLSDRLRFVRTTRLAHIAPYYCGAPSSFALCGLCTGGSFRVVLPPDHDHEVCWSCHRVFIARYDDRDDEGELIA